MKKLTLLLLSLCLSASLTWASGLDLESEDNGLNQDSNLNNETIDINGTFTKKYQPKPISPADKLKILRQRLEKKHEVMVKKKIENIRLKAEIAMYKKLAKAMEQSLGVLNSLDDDDDIETY